MRCKICGSVIEEYIWHEGQNPQGKILRRYECPACGPLHHETLLPLKVEGSGGLLR